MVPIIWLCGRWASWFLSSSQCNVVWCVSDQWRPWYFLYTFISTPLVQVHMNVCVLSYKWSCISEYSRLRCVYMDRGITDSLTVCSKEAGRCIACPWLDRALMHWIEERNREKERWNKANPWSDCMMYPNIVGTNIVGCRGNAAYPSGWGEDYKCEWCPLNLTHARTSIHSMT